MSLHETHHWSFPDGVVFILPIISADLGIFNGYHQHDRSFGLRRSTLAAALAIGLGFTGASFAQSTTGSIFGQAPGALARPSPSPATPASAVQSMWMRRVVTRSARCRWVTTRSRLNRDGAAVDSRSNVTLRVGAGTEVAFAGAAAAAAQAPASKVSPFRPTPCRRSTSARSTRAPSSPPSSWPSCRWRVPRKRSPCWHRAPLPVARSSPVRPVTPWCRSPVRPSPRTRTTSTASTRRIRSAASAVSPCRTARSTSRKSSLAVTVRPMVVPRAA